MSDSSDDLEGFDFDEVLDWIERYYHVVLVVALAVFMFWNRVRTWGQFVDDGQVLFSGNDAWYHYRQTSYTVENWPQTMPFDPWTYFPYGNASGQFGTLLDQLMATAALVVGLGDPDQQTVAMVVLVMPVILGTLTIVPAFLIGRRLGGTFGGVVSVFVLALASGEFLRRSLVGFADHHIAEVLFQSLAVLAVMVALSVAARDKPIYEQLRARDFDELRDPLGWSVLAGIAIGLYLWVWPFGAMLLGILGIYFVVQLSIEFLRGQSPEHTAFVGVVALGTAGVLVLASIDVAGFTPSEFSLLQPGLAFAVSFGCAFMAWLARTWERRGLSPVAYPLAIVATIAVGAVVTLVVSPEIVDTFYRNLVRVFGFWIDPSETGRTVGEVQPLWPDLGVLFNRYGFAVIIAVGAAIWILARLLLGRRVRAEHTLLLVWATLLGMATLTQQRFGYYLVVPVACLAGYAIGDLFRWLDLGFDLDDIELYQVITVAAVVLVVVVPMLIGPSSAMMTADQNGPGQDVRAWDESLDWMQENTPEEGLYADDSTDLEFYGTYERTDDFEYEAGAYGVVSWWDYGHWITQLGERIPHANPHQQGSTTAANFLLSPNESEANDVLSRIDESEEARNRYVMVDWKMANSHTSPTFFYQNQRWGNLPNGKFFAPIQFTDRDVGPGDYFQTLYYDSQNQGFGSFNIHEQAYYESQVVRLYQFHGSAVEPQPVVVEWGPAEFQGQQLPMTQPGQGDPVLREFDTMSEARDYAENTTNARVGGIGALPNERVPALEHYRLVSSSEMHASEGPGYQLTQASTVAGTGMGNNQLPYLRQTQAQWTKTFERVPGAQVEGTAAENATVDVGVEMYNPASNDTFVYTQRTTAGEDGEFSLTVPYSTTGYDEWGPENGRTNVSVRATGEYSVLAVSSEDGSQQAWNGTASVPESAVIGETDEPVTVDLDEIDTTPDDGEIPEDNVSVDGSGNETSGDATGGSGDDTSIDETVDGESVTGGPLSEPPSARTVVTP